MPVRRHVVPETRVRFADDEPPIADRLADTIDGVVPLASVTVQVSVVDVMPLAGMELGENAHADTTGGML